MQGIARGSRRVRHPSRTAACSMVATPIFQPSFYQVVIAFVKNVD
jgi:hypothetical protein